VGQQIPELCDGLAIKMKFVPDEDEE